MQIISVLFVLVYFFLFGSFFILYSLRSSNLAERVEKGERQFYRSYGASWRYRLLVWRVVDHENEASAVLKDVITSWELIQAPQRVAAGITMVLFAVAYLLWIFPSKSAILNNPSLLFTLWIVYALSTYLGSGLGSVIGFWRAKQEGRRRVTYADLRQRRLSDYRSNILRGLLGFVIFLNWVLLLILPSLLKLQSLLPHDTWQGATSMVVIYIVGESFLSYIATLPRLVVTSNPTVAQHADDLLRALLIDDIHVRMLLGIGFLLGAQWFFLFRWLLSSPVSMALQILITSLWLLCLLPTMWRTNDKGRLGGRVTGWPWRKMVVE